jgi:hypothetical protein
MQTINRAEKDRQYKRTQAEIIKHLACELGAKATHRGSTWWEIEYQGKTWKIRGASNAIRSLTRMKGESFR